MGLLTLLGLKKPLPGFRHYLHMRATKQDMSADFSGRQRVHEVANAIGARIPTIYREHSEPADIDDAGLPDAFVVKPNCMWSTKGVMVLRRRSKGVFHDILSRKDVTLDKIIDTQLGWKEKWDSQPRSKPFATVIEEMVIGENGADQIPYDYKCYTFNGEVRFILQINRNVRPVALAFFLNEFATFNYSNHLKTPWKTVQRAEPVIPKCAKQIIEVASAASRYLKTPFVSVDTYASLSGPVIGELTRAPGGPYVGSMFRLKPKLDAEFGAAWRKACDELGEPHPKVVDLGEVVPVRASLVSATPPGGPIARQPGSGAVPPPRATLI